MKMKTLTKEMVNFTIEPLDEHLPIEKELSFEQTGADHSDYIKTVQDDDGHNPWLWCTVKVIAEFEGLTGEAYLGCSAYKNEIDFKRGGYYEQLQDEAFKELKAQIDRIIKKLSE